MVGIYKITSPKGRVYVGQSVNIPKRIKKYKSLCTKGQTRLHNSLIKHGFDRHVIEVIEECDKTNLNERERYWQDYYDVLGKNGLNCRLTGSTDKSGSLSDETKKKLSDSRKNYRHPQNVLDKIAKTKAGKWSGLDSATSKRVVSENTYTGESFVLSLKDTAKKLGVDRGLIMSRLSKKSGYKLKDWNFYLEGNLPTFVFPENNKDKYIIDVLSGVYYYNLNEAGESIGCSGKTLWSKIDRGKCSRFLIL